MGAGGHIGQRFAPLKDDQVRDAAVESFRMMQSVKPDVLELGLEILRAVLADVKVRLEEVRECESATSRGSPALS
jgi:hypothetical protein